MSGHTFSFGLQENELSSVIRQIVPLESTHPELSFPQASDADIGVNAAFQFSILSGNVDDSFSIDSDTGVLSTSKPLDREQRDSYILLVRVADLHGNQSYGQVFDDTAVVEVMVQVDMASLPATVWCRTVTRVSIFFCKPVDIQLE